MCGRYRLSRRATCSINPSAFNAAANGVYGPTVTFSVPALAGALHHRSPFRMPFIFAGVIVGLSFTTRRRRTAMLGLLLVVFSMALVSCGGGGGNPVAVGGGGGTSASQTYKFTITGSAGSYTDTQVLTVTVQK